ncbi:MAG TPA: zinc-dependent metalloprotease [Acidimicrobiales bacterium]|nr:zinc-dependent metalloprotease [Acidimicrobiales bacterium]
MSDINPFQGGGPFEDIMRNLARMFTTQGPVNWELATQFAVWAATGGTTEPNVDPVSRVRLEELLRVAEIHVADATGLLTSGELLQVRAVTPSEWARLALEAWRPLLERLARAMAETLPTGADEPPAADESNPMAQLFGQLPQMLGPVLFGMQAGSMVGQLGRRALGTYDLPMPWPASDRLVFVPPNIERFAADWSLDPDDVRLWVCVREVAYHAVLGRPHVRARLDELIGAYVDAFQPDGRAIEDRLSGVDPSDMGAMQSLFSDPSALLGEMQSDAQRRLKVPLRALLAVVAGYVDYVMDTVGRRLIAGYNPLTEALRRRRLEDSSGAKALGQLLGVELDGADYERGLAFVHGVLERAGSEGLDRLWRSAKELPTPPEVDAPGLWLARIDLDVDES